MKFSRTKLIVTLCLSGLLSSTAAYAANIFLDSYQQARDIFWDEIYKEGGWTIYCGNRIEGRTRDLHIEHVYPMSWVSRYLGCGTRSQCRVESKIYRHIEADLHNFYPARRDANMQRSNFSFGEVGESTRKLPDCDLKIDSDANLVQPSDEVAGDLSRAFLYMTSEYRLELPPAINDYKLLLSWHHADLPDQFEQRRNAEIKRTVGASNIFIDYPELAEKIIKHKEEFDVHFLPDHREISLRKLVVDKNYVNKNLRNMDFSGQDLSFANFYGANLEGARFHNTRLIGANLSDANLTNVRFKNSDLSNAVFRDTKIKDATFVKSSLSNSLFTGVVLDNVNFDRSGLNNVLVIDSEFVNVNFRDSQLNGAKIYYGRFADANFSSNTLVKNASFNKTDFKNVNFSDSRLNDSVLDSVKFEQTYFFDTDLTGVTADLDPDSTLSAAEFSEASGLQYLTYRKTPNSLTALRESFISAGLRRQERQLTHAIESTRTDNTTGAEYWFRYIMYDLTSAYGLSYGRPVFLIFTGIVFFGLLYIRPVTSPTESAILYVEIDEKTGDEKVSPLKSAGVKAVLWSLYFSLLSAFHLGWRDLNVGNWIVRMQTQSFLLRSRGWVRSISGIQSLVSVYLLAIWALTYFGRPFQ